MNCPFEESLLRALVDPQTSHERSPLAHHAEHCVHCTALKRAHLQLLADLRALPARAQSDEHFTASVLSACTDAPPQHVSRAAWRTRRTLSWGSGALVTAAAVLLFVSLSSRPPATESALRLEPQGRYAARGGSDAQHAPAFADVLFVRDGVAARLSGAVLQPGDALAVRCTNRALSRMYLAVFVVDAGGSVHWVYPAYGDESRDPRSIPIEPGLHDRLLDEVVEPAAPALGPLRAYAVWSSTPLGVHAIEAHLPELSASGPGSFFAKAYVQRWSATWNAP